MSHVENTDNALVVGTVCMVIGVVLPGIVKAIVGYFTTNQTISISLIQEQVHGLKIERDHLAALQKHITADLQSQIFTLREQVLTLQKENLAYTQREVKLVIQLESLAAENAQLKMNLERLEAALAKCTHCEQQLLP